MAARKARQPSALDVAFTGKDLFVVLHGSETFLRGELTGRLRAALESHTGSEVETIHFDGQRVSPADVLDELRSFGLMQQHKLIVVDSADGFVKSHREALARYAEKPEPMGTLLLRADQWHKGNLDKAVEKIGQIIKCEPPSRAEALAWVATRAQERYGVTIDRDAAAMLIDHLGTQVGLLDADLGKLAVSVEPGGTIPVQAVQTLVGFASDDAVWAIQDALLAGNPRGALEKLHELIDLAGHDPVPLGWFISDLMRKLHHAAALLEAGQAEHAIGNTLKIWPRERAALIARVARRLGTPGAARLLDAALEMDRRAKSGYGDGARNLERFCVLFAGALDAA